MTAATAATAAVLAAAVLCAAASAPAAAAAAAAPSNLRGLLVSPAYEGAPYQGVAAAIPGVLEAELFDEGPGEGVTYHTVEIPGVEFPDNVIRVEEGGQPVTVQINDVSAANVEGATEEPGEMAAGAGVAGEWQRYTVEVAAAGTYLPVWRFAIFDPEGGDLPVETIITIGTGEEADPCTELKGAGGISLPGVNTGDWKAFDDFASEDPITIPAGTHVLTVCYTDVANFELNYIDFVPADGMEGSAAPSTAPTSAPSSAPSTAPVAM